MSLDISLQMAEDCLRISHILQGHNFALKNEKDSVVKKVEDAKKWLAKQPDYLKFLQHLQTALHQKSIGAFSELLTYFVRDVLKKDKDIVFELYTYHNLPALRIEALNDGCKESIYEGNGGSIANIVSTGLRLIALSRLNHRKFIILDEPDCWLKPDHVPIFAKIIGEISEKLKIQTVIISHHDWHYFKDYGRVIELTSDGKNLESNIIHDTPFEDDGSDYIHSIRLRQLMSHHDTEYRLHPYLTCLIGENDIGKSVLATGVKAFAYNDSSDSYIKHHTDEAQVLIELNKNRQLLWQRFRVTNADHPQKVKYSLFENKQEITSEYNSDHVPNFISKELRIVTTEDIDVHVGNQKQPVFLLSSDVKPQERAKILSLGKESLIIQKMMENIKSKTRQNKQAVKDGEERFDNLNKQLQVLFSVDELVEKSEKVKEEYFGLNKQQESIIKLTETIKDFALVAPLSKMKFNDINIQEPKIKDCDHLENLVNNFTLQTKLVMIEKSPEKIEDIDLLPTTDLEKTIKRLHLVSQGAAIEVINANIEEPNIKNLREVKEIIAQLMSLEKMRAMPELNHDIVHDLKLKDTTYLVQLIKDLEEKENQLKDFEQKKENVMVWEKNIDIEINKFLSENKGICPTCNQTINRTHFSGDSHD